MTIRANDVPQHLLAPFKTAVKQWRLQECPDWFETDITNETEQGPKQLTISVGHHETFPLGGQLFTVDIRSGPYPHILLHRERIEYYQGDEPLGDYDEDDKEDDEDDDQD